MLQLQIHDTAFLNTSRSFTSPRTDSRQCYTSMCLMHSNVSFQEFQMADDIRAMSPVPPCTSQMAFRVNLPHSVTLA